MKTNLTSIAVGLMLSFSLGLSLLSCNSDSEVLTTLPSSSTIRSFSLENNDSVLPNLDSVFFTIDLENLEIFNADSLPYGTNISSLVPVITTESASVLEITYTNALGESETFNYLENTTDTVNFTKPVTLRVVSYNGMNESKYTVKVNVHQVRTDTIVWKRIEGSTLPTLFSAVNAQHTTMAPNGIYYCMTQYQGDYCMAYTQDPSVKWNVMKISGLGFTPDINTLTATNDALYILDNQGILYTSSDNGVTWTSTNVKSSWIIGAYGNKLISTVKNGDTWNILEYPTGKTLSAPLEFPVTNTSTAVTISFEMSSMNQLILIGGKKADGILSSDTWGFDGNSWVKINRGGLPKACQNMALVPYFDIHPDTVGWRVSQPTTVLLALGGSDASGVINETVYMTSNFGLTWVKAPDSMQIPSNLIPARTLAQAFPFTGISYANKKSQLNRTGVSSKALSWETLLQSGSDTPSQSRASQPITEWEVPYIYLFGGIDAYGQTYNTVYRGVLTALTFKPLQ